MLNIDFKPYILVVRGAKSASHARGTSRVARIVRGTGVEGHATGLRRSKRVSERSSTHNEEEEKDEVECEVQFSSTQLPSQLSQLSQTTTQQSSQPSQLSQTTTGIREAFTDMDIQSRSAQFTETPMHRNIVIPSRPTTPVTETDVTTPIGASSVGSQYTRSPTRSRRSTSIIEPNLISPTSAQRTRRFETEFSIFDKRRTSSTDDRAPPL